ncbi:RNA-directed DNA polymerase (reverse transcriptase)-related family protein [Rhynchospora pubera]|uniref:RNA-directed DNA polymerase (Reverse transcriptase)-related family protein n=1 Tax=Rhynchospora pubera TaxID=906938 RepID=A0AAV8EHE3_9POAL|nr:RNA-directed DNA polymerase (reverse transcriptase)-related family protein [Rhynchospora pubera]
MLKLDFSKAFDSVSWPFLFHTLRHRSFPPKFISWISLLLHSSSSSILLNGTVGPKFQHKRGLRQGDPISPSLFLLAADVLSLMIQALSTSIPHGISPKLLHPFILFQYADDTLVFLMVKGQAVRSLLLVLDIFAKTSGLTLNWTKTKLIPFNLTQTDTLFLQSLINCSVSTLPVTYLGLPLTAKRPDRACFQLLIDRISKKLVCWQNSFLSRAGRLVIASSVLSSMPTFFMSSFLLPAWVIKQVDKLRRNFLWSKSCEGKQGIHLVSWERLCLPKSCGGMGMINLKLHNISLMLKWWWRLYSLPKSQWSLAARILFAKRDVHLPPLVWNQSGSFFWKDLRSLRYLFQLSVRSNVNCGKNTLFWYDNWSGSNLQLFGYEPEPFQNHLLTLKNALLSWHVYFPAPVTALQAKLHLVLSSLNLHGNQLDECSWRWRSDGSYSAASIYKTLILAGKTNFPYTFIWKVKAPPSVRLFLYFLALGKILTQEQLLRRNIQVQQRCFLCQQQILETINHLFCECNYTRAVWNLVGLSGMHLQNIDSVFLTIGSKYRDNQHSTVTLLVVTLWGVWLERNNRVFRNTSRQAQTIQEWIVHEATFFLKFA